MLSQPEIENDELRDPLLRSGEVHQIDGEVVVANSETRSRDALTSFIFKTLFPDTDWKISDTVVVEGDFTVKLTKFLFLTIAGIVWLHWLVSHRQNHRDEDLRVWQLWKFDAGLIVRDAMIFFLVGRMWRQQGVDHLAWVGTVLACNLFLEIQHYVPWLQHSFTLYEMHCTWSWQTWGYMIVSIVFSGGIAGLHMMRAWRERLLLMKAMEMAFFSFFFLVPAIPSPYFHFHHWFAGWLVGMHCNFDVWWSSAAMAWCHGLYINGIAVYGRDPVLTCGYAYFLSWDQKCPFLACNSGLMEDQRYITPMALSDNPNEHANWLNCSDNRYHP